MLRVWYVPCLGLSFCLAASLWANPQIELQEGQCPLVGNLVEKQCARQKADAGSPEYLRHFIEINFSLIHKAFNTDGKNSCEEMGRSVTEACNDACAESECTWILDDGQSSGGQNNTAPNASGFKLHLPDSDNAALAPLPPLVTSEPNKNATLPQTDAATYSAGQDKPALSGNGGYIPGVYLIGTPSRKRKVDAPPPLPKN